MNRPRRRVAGYAALADFIASDKVFCIFRRFDKLSVRNLLYMQDELCELEAKLSALDDTDLRSGDEAGLYSLHSRREDQNRERQETMQILGEKLYKYRMSSQVLRS